MLTISLLIDIAAASLLILAAARGGKKGLVRMVTALLILALALAAGIVAFYLLASPLAEALTPFALEHFPTVLTAEEAASVAPLVLEPAVGGLVFSVFFALALIALDTLVKALDLMAKLPVVRQANTLGGAVTGVVECALVLFAAVWAARMLGYPIPEDVAASSLVLRLLGRAVDLLNTLLL